jgi:hypothetical protein
MGYARLEGHGAIAAFILARETRLLPRFHRCFGKSQFHFGSHTPHEADQVRQKISLNAICIVRLPPRLVTIPNVDELFTVVPGPLQVGEFVKL